MIPENLKYVNLQVMVNQTFNADYPTVTHRIFVKDRLNKSIEGLDSSNFRVLDNGKPVEGFTIHQFTPPGNRMKIVVVNDRSVKMKKYNTELRELMDVFLKRLSPADMVKVINFSSGYRDMIPFMNQRLKPLEALTDSNFQENDEAGKALYTGITESFANDFKSRILLITNGELSDNAFAPYDLDGIMSYAKNNNVPVYILCFGEGSRVHELKTLADRTGGHFIQATSSNEVYRLVDLMRSKKDISYFLSYITQTASEFARQAWRTIRVDVNYKDLFGVDEGGYFIP
jgi:VWFA-related protein